MYQCYNLNMSKFIKVIFFILFTLLLLNLGWWGNEYYKSKLNITPNPISYIKHRPLEKYQIENLSETYVPSVDIKIEKELEKSDEFTSYLVSFSFDPTLSEKKDKKVTGLLNVPEGDASFPLIVLFRGYVDQNIYQTGVGTKRVGEYFAKNGYITIAPDFLGYGGSDIEAGNIFESRFQTYTTALTLLNSIDSIEKWDNKNVFIWGHSNGGQIALTALEATGVTYPTVLWAPVTKPFPYSILYYTDESDDRGKLIRKELSKFETDYDVEKFSLTNYLGNIKAPIEIHQGTNDDAIPLDWSSKFVKDMKVLEKEITYLVHPTLDHNMNPLWGDTIYTSLEFFNSKIKN